MKINEIFNNILEFASSINMFGVTFTSFSLSNKIESKLFKPFEAIRRCTSLIKLFHNISGVNHYSYKSN